MHGLQVLRVHDEARELVAIALEPEQHAQAHVVDATLHRAIHRLGVPVVVAFRPRRVQTLVALLVVRFLEQDIRADLGLLEHAVLVHRRSGDVHDLAVLGVIGAVQAAVHAVVRQVQRREKHDAVAVICLLDVVRKLLDGLVHPRILAG